MLKREATLPDNSSRAQMLGISRRPVNKTQMAMRLRRETLMARKWIAERLEMGTSERFPMHSDCAKR